MTERSAFFASAPGDLREYDQLAFAGVLASAFVNGVVPGRALELAVTHVSGLTIRVRSGEAWVQGYWYSNEADKNLTLAPGGAAERTDMIILRLTVGGIRSVEAVIKSGTTALTQTAAVWEIELARITVPAGVGAITPADISDRRTFGGARVVPPVIPPPPDLARIATITINKFPQYIYNWSAGGGGVVGGLVVFIPAYHKLILRTSRAFLQFTDLELSMHMLVGGVGLSNWVSPLIGHNDFFLTRPDFVLFPGAETDTQRHVQMLMSNPHDISVTLSTVQGFEAVVEAVPV